MKLEHYPEKQLKKQIAQIVSRHLNPSDYKIFFFGSRVAGNSFERSDIDVGIEGDRRIDIITMANIEEEIAQLPILYKIDVVDFTDVGERFYRIAGKHREYICDMSV